MLWLRKSRPAAWRFAAYAVSVPAVALSVWIGLLAAHANVKEISLTPLEVAIALIAWYGGLGPGLFTLIQSAVAIDFFFIEPGTLFRLTGGAQAAAFSALIAGWLLVCLVAGFVFRRMHRDRQQRIVAQTASFQANRVAQLTAALAQARTPRSAIEAAVQEPLHALKADAGMLLLTSRDGATAEVARAVAHPHGNHKSTVTLSEKDPISDAVGRGAPV